MFDTEDYKNEIRRRAEEEQRKKIQYEQERRANLVPQGIRIPTEENGTIPASSNPLRALYDTQNTLRNNLEQQERIDKQPNLLSGGNFEYQQPTRQTSYQPNKITTGLTETATRDIPEDELQFDGKNLHWINDNKIYKSWPAMSGRKEYQSAQHQNLPNKGPLPEGSYDVNQDQLQHFDDLNLLQKAASWGGFISKGFGKNLGPWSGATPSWGKHRVWLKPYKTTNTYGRSNFSIHGGWEPGSAGCVDLTDGMDDFNKNYQDYGANLKLRVKYPKNW